MMCKLPDYILREFRENFDKVTAPCSSAHFDLVSKMQGSRYRSPLPPFAQKNKIWHKKS